ncbi:sulfatase [Leptospira limi]|uniref:Sulfatase-like hydrolase/transferase n=1 Tax=Leptospira limi TaxID=2950023 RepID=A0ABT3LS13_9LEPT|nr:sulfatase-like hydrolase/transferase [Leptospira limi]MCW7460526.1 sulfatase-like hydrolase/transferase [Leptospira limi]
MSSKFIRTSFDSFFPSFLLKLFLFLLLSLLCVCQKESARPEKNLLVEEGGKHADSKPNVIWIVIDSLRGDIIGQYNVTPNLDLFAKEGIQFDFHLVNAAWTRPSTLVFFTGKYASANPVNFWDYPTTKSEVEAFYRSEKKPLPKLLKEFQYNTVMVGNNPFLTDKFGLGVEVGFDSLYDFSNYSEDTKKITKKTMEVLEEVSTQEKPFFLFLNYNDPHKPYTPPLGFTNRIKTSESLDERKLNYLGEVAFVDEELGKVFADLKTKNLWDNSLILITADHGEVMHASHAISPFTGTNTYYGHGQDLFLENIHVPLLIKLPHTVKQKTVKEMTRSIDLYPTILDYAELPIPNSIHGLSLRPIIEGTETTKRTYYGETRFTQGYGEGKEFLLQRSYRFHELGKFWQGSVGNEFYLYFDTTKDPNQISPIRINQMENIGELKLDAKLEKKIQRFWKQIRSMEPKLPLYHLWIRPNPLEKDTEIQIKVQSGILRLAKFPNTVVVEEKGKLVNIHTKDSQPFQISFEVYPDVSFPEFQVWFGKKQVPKSDIHVGYFGVSMSACSKDCDLLYESQSIRPIIHPETKVHFWKEGGQKKSYESKQELGTDALDILKKQGYVQ